MEGPLMWEMQGKMGERIARMGGAGLRCALVVAALGILNQCKTAPTADDVRANTPPAQRDVRDNLAELAKGHRDKVKFAWYATTLRRLDPSVRDFAKRMGDGNKLLLDQLQAWAKKNQVDITFHYDKDIAGHAREQMEKEQGDQIQADNAADFQRDLLMTMWTDYDWQRNLAAVMAKNAADPELKAYLEANVRMLEAGIKEIRTLLAKYKYEK